MASTRSEHGAGKVPPGSSPLKDAIYMFSTQYAACPINEPPCPMCCENETKPSDTDVFILPCSLLCLYHKLTAQQDTFYVSIAVVEEDWVPKIIDWLTSGVKGRPSNYPWEIGVKRNNFFDSLCKYAGYEHGINTLIECIQGTNLVINNLADTNQDKIEHKK